MAKVPAKQFYTKVDPKGKFGPNEVFKKVRPVPSAKYFLNPHKGIATFQHFNGDPLFKNDTWTEKGPTEFNLKKKPVRFVKGYSPSTVSYCRWYWRTIEPEMGKFRWDIIEKALKCAELRGQSLEVRLMAFGELDTPDWYKKIAPHDSKRDGHNYLAPDHNHPLFFKYWSRVIREFAKKFGNHYNLDTFDIAVLGPWGEGAGEMNKDIMERFLDVYMETLPRHKIVVNSDGYQMVYGSKFDIGWRGDCFGHMNNAGQNAVPNGLGWNHMFDSYPRVSCEANATENWKRGPLLMETCWNPLGWHKGKMPLEMLDWMIEQFYKYHASIFMPKYSLLPKPYMPKFMEMAKKLGYRYVFRQFLYDKKLKGNWFRYQAWIENTGVAPMYRDLYNLAFRFTQGKKKVVVQSSQDIRRWMPGDAWLKEDITIPARFNRGEVMIETAIVSKKTSIPKVWFANEGYSKDGWLKLDTIEIDR